MGNPLPNIVTTKGRLSWPVFKHADAVVRNAAGKFKNADPSKVKPEFNLLVEQDQLDKIKSKIIDEWAPNEKKNPKSRLTADQVDLIVDAVKAGKWATSPINLPIKEVPKETKKLAPEAVAMIKCFGNEGVDIVEKSIVRTEADLNDAHKGDIVAFPSVLPISHTVNVLYAGALTSATLNLYGYVTGKTPGLSAGADTAVFNLDADRFGGGVSVDENEMFADE